MTKGLGRSISRGPAGRQPITRRDIRIEDLTVTVSATGAAIGFGSAVIEDLPQGNILLLGAVAYIGLAGSGADDNLADTWSGDYGIGSTPASDATITAGDVDIIPSTAVGAAVDEVIGETRGANATQVMLDNTDGSLELNLNVLIDAANIVDDESVDLTASGKLHLAYIVLGDD